MLTVWPLTSLPVDFGKVKHSVQDDSVEFSGLIVICLQQVLLSAANVFLLSLQESSERRDGPVAFMPLPPFGVVPLPIIL